MAVRIDTLGGISVALEEEELTSLPRQTVRCALLLYLAVDPSPSRDGAMGLLWPDRDPDRARGALNQTLYELRKSLGDAWLETRGEFLVLGAEVQVDAVAFSEAVDREDFETALRLYRGSFLGGSPPGAGSEFEHWFERHASRLAGLHRRARRAEIETLYERGEREAALRTARGWLDLEPVEDEAAHWVIRLQGELGRRSQALDTWARYAGLVRQQLEIEPLEETQHLVQQIRDAELDTGVPVVSAPPGGETSRGEAAKQHPFTPYLRWGAMAALVLLLLWSIGFLTTRAFDQKLSMPQDLSPSRSDFVLVGLRALIPSLLYAAMYTVAVVAMAGLWQTGRLVLREVRNAPDGSEAGDPDPAGTWKSRWLAFWDRLPPAAAGHLFFLAVMLSSVVILGRFQPLLRALWSSDTSALSALNATMQYQFTMGLTAYLMILVLAQHYLFQYLGRRTRGDGQVAIARWGSRIWTVVLILVMTIPWRLQWEDHPRALVNGTAGYVVAETEQDLVIFQPATGRTTHHPRSGSGNVELLGTSGHVFEGPERFQAETGIAPLAAPTMPQGRQ